MKYFKLIYLLFKKHSIYFYSVFFRFIGIYFIFTAISKAQNFSQIEETLLFLGFAPFLTETIGWILISFELLLGLLMVFLLADKLTTLFSIPLLFIFSFIIIYLLFQPEAPHCGCTGNFFIFKSAFYDNLAGLFRNIIFIIIIYLRRNAHYKNK